MASGSSSYKGRSKIEENKARITKLRKPRNLKLLEISAQNPKPTAGRENLGKVKSKKPQGIDSIEPIDHIRADQIPNAVQMSLSPNAVELRDITELVTKTSAFCTKQVERGILRLDECLIKLNKADLELGVRIKLLVTICEAYLLAGKFHRAAEIVSAKELAEMTPLDCRTQVVHLRLVCCAAEANAHLYNREQVEACYQTAESIDQDLPEKLDDDVYEEYKDVRCRLDEIEKLLSNYHCDRHSIVMQRVEKAGGVLELPDCSIYFPSNSFPRSSLVQATTTVVTNRTPTAMVPVTPILRLSPNANLLNPATMKLVTWVSSENPVLIHLYYKQSEKSTWSALQSPLTYHKGNNRIEFQTTQFCSFCGFVDEDVAHRTEFRIMSRLFFSKERKQLANRLFPCCDTYKQSVRKEMAGRTFLEQVCSAGLPLTIKEFDEVEVSLMDLKQTSDGSQGQDLKSVKVKLTLDYLKRGLHRSQNVLLPFNFVGLVEFNHIVKQFRDGKILDGEDDEHQDRIELGNSEVDNRGASINAQLINSTIVAHKDAHIAERDGLHDHRQTANEEGEEVASSTPSQSETAANKPKKQRRNREKVASSTTSQSETTASKQINEA